MREDPSEFAALLEALARGDQRAGDRVFALVYDELRAIAGSLFRDQPAGHTLQPTALVHDAYMRLARSGSSDWSGRSHFLAVAARAMRQILTDHARRRGALKRGGDRHQVTLADAESLTTTGRLDLLALDEAIVALHDLNPRKARVVELRTFGGLGHDQIARILDVSRATVVDDWTVARAWLRARLDSETTP